MVSGETAAFWVRLSTDLVLSAPKLADRGGRHRSGRWRVHRHVNGDPHDNLLEILLILCPNSLSLTDPWCVLKKRPAYSNRQRDIA